MIEAIMYFGIGFLVASLLGLLFIPPVHNRVVRLTAKRLEASTPLGALSEAERQLADKEAELTKLLGKRSLVAR
jgi:hypothetical protein